MNYFQLLQMELVELILVIEQDIYIIYHPSSPSGNCLNHILLVLWGFFLFNGEEGLTWKIHNYMQDI